MNKHVEVIMFDIPMVEKEMQKRYRKFRKELLKRGFMQFQESVYIKVVRDVCSFEIDITQLKDVVPKDSLISAFTLTMKQFQGIRSIGDRVQNINIFIDDILVV